MPIKIYHDEEQQYTIIKCCRDKRRNAIDPITGRKGTINQYIKRHGYLENRALLK